MNQYYFVAYELRLKDKPNESPVFTNVILKNKHPLVWLSHPPADFAKHYVGYIHFWTEIPEDIALQASDYVNVED